MIVEPMVQRGLPRKDSINPLSKKQNLGILTFYKVRLFKNIDENHVLKIPIYLIMQEYHDLFKVVDELHK